MHEKEREQEVENTVRMDGEIRYISPIYFTKRSQVPFLRFKFHWWQSNMVSWIQVQAYRELAEAIKDLENGTYVTIWGELQMRRKQTTDGWETWHEMILRSYELKERSMPIKPEAVQQEVIKGEDSEDAPPF
jgi:single-stranded DNA-binding protein